MLEPKNPMPEIHVGTACPAAYGRRPHREQGQVTSCCSKQPNPSLPYRWTQVRHPGLHKECSGSFFPGQHQIFCFLRFPSLTLRKIFSMRPPPPATISLHSSPLQIQTGRATGLEARMSSHSTGEVGHAWFLAFDARFLETNFTIT